MMSLVSMLLSLLLAAVVTHVSARPGDVRADGDFRIPKNVVPEHYRLFVRPNYPTSGLVNSKTFDGQVVITAKIVGSAATKIVLHKGATITEIQVVCILKVSSDDIVKEDYGDVWGNIANFCKGDDFVRMDDKVEDETLETFTINLNSSIEVGTTIRIALTYEAEYPEGGLTGFYVSQYDDTAMLTTKFEPTHARKAFPCFDEPAFKATFDLVVEYAEGIDVISNMEKAWSNETNRIVAFETTPVMSTYLLAFIVYEEASFKMKDDILRPLETVPYRTWGRSSMVDEDMRTYLSQVEGPAALAFLESYADIPYNDTMTKMDMAAIPDFQSGAMENWGLVTYRENYLLYSVETGTTVNYKRVLDVIAHELTHMWFGNLVTTDWWSSIWLNEGFARYMQYLVVHDRYPNWHMLERFVLDEQMGVFGTDAVASAPALTHDVYTPEQIGNHFGTISYSKGGAILRQIRNVMGEENFQKGIRAYLKARSLSTATPEDLFEHLAEYNVQSRTHLTKSQFINVLTSWTTQPGYPVISVRREDDVFTISQERFLLSGAADNATAISYPVYLTFTSAADEEVVDEPLAPYGWLQPSDESVELSLEGVADSDWVLFNAYQGGYYRVNYDAALWTRIGATLDREEGLREVSALDRAALVDNVLALAQAGVVSYERAFRVLRFLRHDTAFEPWAAARTALAHLQRMLGHEQAFQEFIAYVVEKAYNATGFDVGRNDAHIDKVHRTNVLTVACSAGYKPCLSEARRRLRLHLSFLSISVPADLESVVFCYGLKNDTGTLWNKLWANYDSADAAQRSTLISALGCINHRDTLKDFLTKSLSDEVRSQDAYTVFSSVYANPDGAAVALDFLTFWGYDKLENRYGAVRNAMSTVVSGLASRLSTKAQKEQLEHAVADYRSRHESAITTVQTNIDWLKQHDSQVVASLGEARSYVYTQGAPPRCVATALLLLCSVAAALLR